MNTVTFKIDIHYVIYKGEEVYYNIGDSGMLFVTTVEDFLKAVINMSNKYSFIMSDGVSMSEVTEKKLYDAQQKDGTVLKNVYLTVNALTYEQEGVRKTVEGFALTPESVEELTKDVINHASQVECIYIVEHESINYDRSRNPLMVTTDYKQAVSYLVSEASFERYSDYYLTTWENGAKEKTKEVDGTLFL